MVSSTGTFVSCKDYDDDIDEINNKLNTLETTVAELQKKIVDGAYVKSITPNAEGFVVTMSDGTTTTIKSAKGQDGKDGTQWTITEDGYWACDGEKTNVKAVGVDGQDGQQQVKKENGKWYLWNGTDFEEVAVGASAATGIPYYYEDATDPNYTILVIYDENGTNKKEIRLPMNSGLGQVIVLSESETMNIFYSTFNGVHQDGDDAVWAWESEDGSAKAKTLPEAGKYMVTASSNAYYVQVIPANYDISKLNFKLVNSKGDVAPITLGTAEPCNEALAAREVSESGVYAIPFTLNEMTTDTKKFYEDNIRGKALSLVATESVRSTYENKLEVAAADNGFGAFEDIDIATADLGKDFTVTPTAETFGNVYDAYLTMADATAKADSVRYGVKINGMKVSYSKDIKAGTVMNLKVNQLNARAMVKAGPDVKVTFGKEKGDVTEYTFVQQKHEAAIIYTDKAGKEVNKQYLDVDFDKFFDVIAPTEGERLVWNQDMTNVAVESVMWTPAAKDGSLMDATKVESFATPVRLDDKGKVINTNTGFKTLRLQFTEDYKGINLGNGSLIAKVTFTNPTTQDQSVAYIPFVVNEPSAATIATWFTWNAQNSYANETLTKNVDVSADAATINLNDDFAANAGYSVELVKSISQDKDKNGDLISNQYSPNMSIGNYPASLLQGLDATNADDLAKINAIKDMMTWTDYNNTTHYNSATQTSYTNNAQLKIKHQDNDGIAIDEAYFNNAYTINGIRVKALGTGVTYNKATKEWESGEDRTFAANSVKLVLKNIATDRANVMTFSKDLQIASVKDQYITLYNSMYTPNESSVTYFGSFTLTDYTGKKYELTQTTAFDVEYWDEVTSAYVSASGLFTVKTSDEYTYGETGEAAYGIKLTYVDTKDYTTAKTFKVRLIMKTNYKLDGIDKTDNVVIKPFEVKVGGI